MSSDTIMPSKSLDLAVAAFNEGKFTEAEGLSQAILIDKPDLFNALALLAAIQISSERWKDALESYNRILAGRPNDAPSFHNRGTVLQHMGQFENALESYDQALKLREDVVATHNNRGKTLQELKRYSEALTSYDKAVELSPDHADTLRNRGDLLMKLKRYAEALQSYDRSIAIKPDYAHAFWHRGIALRELNQFDAALMSREKAVALNPDYGPFYRRLNWPDSDDVSDKSSPLNTTENREETLKVYWCLGMQGSASTWAYNTARQIAAAVHPTLPVQEHFVLMRSDVDTLCESGRTHIVKTHDLDDDDAVAALAELADAIVITIRDPRDAVTSLMSYQHYSFDRVLSLVEKSARLCARFASDPRSLVLRYETGFADDITTLDRIASAFCGSLSATDRTRIFASGRRAAVEAFIAGMPQRGTTLIDKSSGDLMDTVTHWHAFHAGRTGEIGRWRHTLTEAQVKKTEQRLRDWMEFFSY